MIYRLYAILFVSFASGVLCAEELGPDGSTPLAFFADVPRQSHNRAIRSGSTLTCSKTATQARLIARPAEGAEHRANTWSWTTTSDQLIVSAQRQIARLTACFSFLGAFA